MGGEDSSRIRREIDRSGFFQAFDDDARAELASRSRLQPFVAGQALFRNGGPGRHFFLISKGRVKVVSVGPRGNELVLGLNDAGDLTGFVSPLDGGERFLSAIALRAGEAIAIPGGLFLRLAEKQPAVLIRTVRLLTENLRAAATLTQTIGLLDARTRLWGGLMRMAPRYGRPSAHRGGLWIEHGLSQEDLAATVGITRVMASRALRTWREAGLIETGRGYVHVLDPDQLADHVMQND